MVRVHKAELDALIEATARVSRELTGIVAAVREGRPDAEVEITETILAVNALADQLRVLRRRETLSPLPAPAAPIDPVRRLGDR